MDRTIAYPTKKCHTVKLQFFLKIVLLCKIALTWNAPSLWMSLNKTFANCCSRIQYLTSAKQLDISKIRIKKIISYNDLPPG